jgi:hypothetical protein
LFRDVGNDLLHFTASHLRDFAVTVMRSQNLANGVAVSTDLRMKLTVLALSLQSVTYVKLL